MLSIRLEPKDIQVPDVLASIFDCSSIERALIFCQNVVDALSIFAVPASEAMRSEYINQMLQRSLEIQDTYGTTTDGLGALWRFQPHRNLIDPSRTGLDKNTGIRILTRGLRPVFILSFGFDYQSLRVEGRYDILAHALAESAMNTLVMITMRDAIQTHKPMSNPNVTSWLSQCLELVRDNHGKAINATPVEILEDVTRMYYKHIQETLKTKSVFDDIIRKGLV